MENNEDNKKVWSCFWKVEQEKQSITCVIFCDNTFLKIVIVKSDLVFSGKTSLKMI